MKKRYFATIVLIALTLSLFASCSSSSSVVGRWRHESGNEGSDIEFFKDGTGILEQRSIDWKIEDNRIIVTSMGIAMSLNFKLSGDELTISYSADPSGTEMKFTRVKK